MASHSLRTKCLRPLIRATSGYDCRYREICSSLSINLVRPFQTRFLVSSVSSEKSSLDLSTQRKAVEEILNVPDYLSDHWFQAEDLMPFWMSQDSEESVKIVFDLIDRLEKEQRKLPSLNRAWWINSQLLELAIQKWVDTRQRANPPSTSLSPRDIFDKIDSYSEVFPEVNYTGAMMNVIGNEFASSSIVPSFDEATFGELLIERTLRNEETQLARDLFINAIHIWYNAAKEEDHLSPPELYHVGQRILFLLELMEACKFQPDSRVYNLAIKIWKWVVANPCSPQEKQQVVDAMKEKVWNNPGNFFDTDRSSFPWSQAYTSVFQSMCSSKGRLDQLSDAVSSYMELVQSGYVDCSSKQQTQALNAALEALAGFGSWEAVDEADRVYAHMRSTGLEDDSTLKWRVSVLSGSGQIDEAKKLLASFEQSENRAAVIDAHFVLLEDMARSNNPFLMRHAEKVRTMLTSDPSLSADTAMFNSFLSCIGSPRKEETQYLSPELERMKWAQRAFLCMDVFEFLKASAENGQAHLAPNGDSYYHIMHCWARCGNDRLALYWFGAMIKAFRLGNKSATPKLRDFNEALRVVAHSDSQESVAGKAEQIFNTISVIGNDDDYLSPDIESYRLVLSCLAKDGDKEAAFRAENILQRASGLGVDLMNDEISSSLIVSCLEQAGQTERVERLLSNGR